MCLLLQVPVRQMYAANSAKCTVIIHASNTHLATVDECMLFTTLFNDTIISIQVISTPLGSVLFLELHLPL